MDNMTKIQITDSFMDLIDGETVAEVMTILSRYQADDVIEVEWTGYEDVDISVYRTREKTEEELKLDTLDKALEEELSELRVKIEGEKQSVIHMITRTQADLADLQSSVRELRGEEADRARIIRSHYAQKAETVI